jgi:hypothetical protein
MKYCSRGSEKAAFSGYQGCLKDKKRLIIHGDTYLITRVNSYSHLIPEGILNI